MEITAHGSSGTGQLLKDISNKSRVDNIRRRQCWRRRAWLGRHSISLMCVLLCRAEGNKEGELCVKSRWAENGRLARKFRHHKVRAIYIYSIQSSPAVYLSFIGVYTPIYREREIHATPGIIILHSRQQQQQMTGLSRKERKRRRNDFFVFLFLPERKYNRDRWLTAGHVIRKRERKRPMKFDLLIIQPRVHRRHILHVSTSTVSSLE